MFEFKGQRKVNFVPNSNNAIEYFLNYFDNNVVDIIVEETNRYYEQNPVGERQKMIEWTNVSRNEIYTFLAITMLMGNVRKSQISDYWCTNPLISTPIFSQYFSRNRYKDVLRFLHFCDNNNSSEDRSNKIKEIFSALKQKWSTSFSPGRNLCIDESLLKWKGRLNFKQYIPSKRSRFGIKFFILADSETSYILDSIIYTGSSTNLEIRKEFGYSASVVLQLMKPYFNLGHSLFVDNWYTSPILFEQLFELKTNACGTVRPSRKGLPYLKDKLAAGETKSYFTKDMMALKWKDKREVFILSSLHDDSFENSKKINSKNNEFFQKPKCIIDYSNNMGGVDRNDMQISFSECVRKSVKWYKKVFFHILDITVRNAYVLYKLNTGKILQLSDFRLEIINSLLEIYGVSRKRIGRPAKNPSFRLIQRHFPDLLANYSESKRSRKECAVCKAKNIRKETIYFCKDCNVPLCVIDCFKIFHTKQNF